VVSASLVGAGASVPVSAADELGSSEIRTPPEGELEQPATTATAQSACTVRRSGGITTAVHPCVRANDKSEPQGSAAVCRANRSHLRSAAIQGRLDDERWTMGPRTIALLAVTAAATVAVGVAIARSAGGASHDRRDVSRTLDHIDAATARAATPPAFATSVPALLPAAADPASAVRGLLDALIASDAHRSYSLLASADRAAVGTEASWEERLHSLPHYLTYTIVATDGGVVTTDVATEPRLDEVVGYVPARAHVMWATVAEDGGYRVSFADSTTTPVLPADDAARDVAQAWINDAQQCRAGASYDGNLLGQPTLADALCHASGPFTARPPVALDRFRDPSLVLVAFGADAPTFVRVVPVDGPTPFQLALAPFDDTWEVIGVMPA
jgi:hypothetical protein